MSDAEHENSQAGQEGGGTDGSAPAGSPPNLADLKQLGRYKILRELGRGAMGIVFEAVDPKIGRKVALKVLTSVPGISDSELEEFRSRFFREARTAGSLSHPNIVIIHDVDHEEELGISYMAMEFLKGQTLYDLLRSGVKFTREQAIDLCIQVAEGLDHAHRQGVIHRDVKPANLMLLEDGTVKITDFGIAKISTSNLTKTGQFLGTPNYMSPEQVIGHVIDGRSDLFGLGIILYELLTGEKPFMGSSLTTITYQIVNVDPIEPSKIQPGIPRVFDDIVSTLLRKAPDERYQTGKEVAEALRGARDSLGGGPGTAASLATGAASAGSADETQVGTDSMPQATRPAPAPVKTASEESFLERTGKLVRQSNPRVLSAIVAAAFLVIALVLVVISLGGDDEDPSGGDPTTIAGQTDPGTTPPGGSVTSPGGSGTAPVTTTPGTSDPVEPEPEPEPAKPEPEPAATKPAPAKPEPSRPDPAKPTPSPEPSRPKPVEPEPQPVLVKPQAEPLPINPSKPPASSKPTQRLGQADVTLRFEHKLKDGSISLEVDGVRVASYSFESDKKKGGSLLESLEIEEGSHSVRMCLESDQMKEKTICAHRQHSFVMNTSATIRALHQKPPLGKDKFSFSIE